MLKCNYFIFICLTIGFQQLHCEIGNLAVKKAKALILNKAQREQCNSLIPEADSCDQAYRAIDKYCDGEAVKIDRECDKSFKKLVDKCNSAEKSIKERCQKKNGYVTAECGRLFERLDTVCRIVSNTQSRHCTKMYRKMESECNKKYSKITLKCKRILDRYKDFCESDLSSNYWNETYKDGEFSVDEKKIKIENVKKMAEEENFFEENNIINYVKSINEKKKEVKKNQLNIIHESKIKLIKKEMKKTITNPLQKISNINNVQVKNSKNQMPLENIKLSMKKSVKSNKNEIKEGKLNKKSLIDDYNMIDIEELIEKVETTSKKTKKSKVGERKKEIENKKEIKTLNNKKSFLDNFNIKDVLASILKREKLLKINQKIESKKNTLIPKTTLKKPVRKSFVNDFKFEDIENEYNEKVVTKHAAPQNTQTTKPTSKAAGKKSVRKSFVNDFKFEDIENEYNEKVVTKRAARKNKPKPASKAPVKKPVRKSLVNDFNFEDIENEYNEKVVTKRAARKNKPQPPKPASKAPGKKPVRKSLEEILQKSSNVNLPDIKKSSFNFFYDFNLDHIFNNLNKRSHQ